VDALGGALGEDLLELVRAAVRGGEDEHVRDVVEEAWARAVVSPIAVADAPGEQVEHAVVMDRAGVEDRVVARSGARLDDRRSAYSPYGDDAFPPVGVGSHGVAAACLLQRAYPYTS
jgi:hypothetical protein